jgi:hypothetical protein
MLGYALGRGLTRDDFCLVKSIVAQLSADGFRAQTLIREIVLSPQFRYQQGAIPSRLVEDNKPNIEEATH